MPQPTAICSQQLADLQRGNGSWPCYSYETSWNHGVCRGMWWRKNLSILYLSNYIFSPFVPLWARRGWLLLPADQNFHTSRQRTCVCQRQIHPLDLLLLLHLLRLIVPPLLHPEMPKHELSGQWWEVDLCIYEPIHIQKPSKVRDSKHGHIYIYICEYTQVSFWVLAFSIWSQQNDIPQVHTCIYTCGRFPKQMQVVETHSINMGKVANV